MKYLLSWVIAFALVSAIDGVWHLLIFKNRYRAGIERVANVKNGKVAFKGISALISQILVVTSIMILVLMVIGLGGSYQQAAIVGALAGTLAISVYGLVNYALIKNWSLDITILEVVWGPIIGASSGLLVAYLNNIL